MHQVASRAYGEIANRTASDQQVELSLFQQVTRALQNVDRAERVSPTDWADAINRNLSMWTTLAVDLSHPNNGLPVDMKRSLITLSDFVRRTSMEVLQDEASLADLIEINTTIIGGLAQSASAGEAA